MCAYFMYKNTKLKMSTLNEMLRARTLFVRNLPSLFVALHFMCADERRKIHAQTHTCTSSSYKDL